MFHVTENSASILLELSLDENAFLILKIVPDSKPGHQQINKKKSIQVWRKVAVFEWKVAIVYGKSLKVSMALVYTAHCVNESRFQAKICDLRTSISLEPKSTAGDSKKAVLKKSSYRAWYLTMQNQPRNAVLLHLGGHWNFSRIRFFLLSSGDFMVAVFNYRVFLRGELIIFFLLVASFIGSMQFLLKSNDLPRRSVSDPIILSRTSFNWSGFFCSILHSMIEIKIFFLAAFIMSRLGNRSAFQQQQQPK